MDNGITFNKETGRYETAWGWMTFNFRSGDVQVSGPAVNKWFDAERALRTASMYMPYCPTPGMAVALAIHYQYAAWEGGRQLAAAVRG